MPEHMLVSETDRRVEVIGDAGRRRYRPVAEKLRIVTERPKSSQRGPDTALLLVIEQMPKTAH